MTGWSRSSGARMAIAALTAMLALGGCIPSKESAMTHEDVAAVVRAEARAMAVALGHNVTEYEEDLIPCLVTGQDLSTFAVSMRLVADPDRAAGMRTGYLAERQAAGGRCETTTPLTISGGRSRTGADSTSAITSSPTVGMPRRSEGRGRACRHPHPARQARHVRARPSLSPGPTPLSASSPASPA